MQIADEYIEGYSAFVEGHEITECPCSGDAAESWAQGWNNAKEDAEDEEFPI